MTSMLQPPVLDDAVHLEHPEVEPGEKEEGGDTRGGQRVKGLVHYQEPEV